MSAFAGVFVAMLAALGVTLAFLDLLRFCRIKRKGYACVCFREELLGSEPPDMLVIVKSDEEAEEVIRRICEEEDRTVYIKYL